MPELAVKIPAAVPEPVDYDGGNEKRFLAYERIGSYYEVIGVVGHLADILDELREHLPGGNFPEGRAYKLRRLQTVRFSTRHIRLFYNGSIPESKEIPKKRPFYLW